jgi:hypothetical protein
VAEPIVDRGGLDPELIITHAVYVDQLVYAPASGAGDSR